MSALRADSAPRGSTVGKVVASPLPEAESPLQPGSRDVHGARRAVHVLLRNGPRGETNHGFGGERHLVVLISHQTFERVTRIELALSAWEADVLPLNYTRVNARTS
jgi:hypothetical protein